MDYDDSVIIEKGEGFVSSILQFVFYFLAIATIPLLALFACSQIQGTPTWVQNGIILGSGYNFPEQMAQKSYPDFVKDYLIPNKIEMFFSYSCTWCKKQIAEFGNVQWNEYLQSGLTKDCSKEFNFTETEG